MAVTASKLSGSDSWMHTVLVVLSPRSISSQALQVPRTGRSEFQQTSPATDIILHRYMQLGLELSSKVPRQSSPGPIASLEDSLGDDRQSSKHGESMSRASDMIRIWDGKWPRARNVAALRIHRSGSRACLTSKDGIDLLAERDHQMTERCPLSGVTEDCRML